MNASTSRGKILKGSLRKRTNAEDNGVFEGTTGSRKAIKAKCEPPSLKWKMNSGKNPMMTLDPRKLLSKKQKGKVQNTGMGKESTTSIRVTRSRTIVVSHKDKGTPIECKIRDRLTPTNLGGGKRKRGREPGQLRAITKPRKASAKSGQRFLSRLANIKEEKSGPNGEPLSSLTTPEVSSRELELNREPPQSTALKVEIPAPKTTLGVKKFTPQHVFKTTATKKEATTVRPHDYPSTFPQVHARKVKAKQKKGTRKLGVAKKLNPFMLNVVGGKKTSLLRGATGLKLLAEPTRRTPQDFHTSKEQFSDSSKISETIKVEEQSSTNIQETSDYTPEVGVNPCNVRTVTQCRTTTSALKIADDTSGFVRTTLKAVEDSKSIDEQIREGALNKKKVKENYVNNPKFNMETLNALSSREDSSKVNPGSRQIKTTTIAEKLIQELAAKGNAKEISRESTPKGSSKTVRRLSKRRTSRSSRTPSDKETTKDGETDRNNVSDYAPSSEDNPQESNHTKLGRKARKEISNHIKKYGLQEAKHPRSRGWHGANSGVAAAAKPKQRKSLVVSGFDRLISGAGGDKEFETALASVVSAGDDDNGGLIWTKDQELALQTAYSTIKPSVGVDLWQQIAKRVPGRSAEECYNRCNSKQPDPPPPAQSPKATDSSPSLLHPPTKSKITRNQRDLEAQKTIHTILKHAEDVEDYRNSHKHTVGQHHPVESLLDKEEDDEAVILTSTSIESDDDVAVLPERTVSEDQTLDRIVISGLGTPSNKENKRPEMARALKNRSLEDAHVILKQVNNFEHLQQYSSSRPRTTSKREKKSPTKCNNVYLHSQDALDFGDTTVDAIHRAKQELRKVYMRTGSMGDNFFDIETDFDRI